MAVRWGAVVMALALGANLLTEVAAHGQPPWYCGIKFGGELESVKISVRNPVTGSTETSEIRPKVGHWATATVNVPRGTNATATYHFKNVPVSAKGQPPFTDSVAYIGFKHSVYSIGACLDEEEAKKYLPTATVTYEDEGRPNVYTVGTYTVHNDNLGVSGYTLVIGFFEPADYPGACGPESMHDGGDQTKCIVPHVLLSMPMPPETESDEPTPVATQLFEMVDEIE